MWGNQGGQWVGLSGAQPDFGNTLARVMQIRALQQRGEQVSRETEAQNRLSALLQRPGFVQSLGQNDPNALAELGAVGPAGLNLALPRLDELRQLQEWQTFRGGAPVAARGGPPVAGTAPGATPVASAPLPGMAGVPEQWRGAVEASARLRGVDPDDLANLLAVESGWNPNAVSPRGARGLGQQMPGTAAELGIDPRDPQQSIDGAARYLAQQQHRFGRSGGFAAYNAGPGRVERATQNGEINLAALPAETQQYTTRLSGGGAPVDRTRAPLASTIPGAPSPAEFARWMELAPRNRFAAEMVKLWQPYMLRENAQPPETWEPMSDEQRRQYRVPQNVPAEISNRGAIRLPGQPQTPAGETPMATLAAKNFGQLQEAAQDANRREQIIDRLGRLLPQFNTGMGAEALIAFGQAAKRLGFDIRGTSEGEMILALQRQLELALTPRGQGQITENERALIRQQINVLGSTREGATQLLGFAKQLAEYDRQAAKIAREHVRGNNGAVDPVGLAEALATLGPRPSIEDVADARPDQPNPQPGQARLEGAPYRVQVRTPEEALNLPPGTPIQLPDGRIGTVPE